MENNLVLKAAELNFASLRALVGNKIGDFLFNIDNGCKLAITRKVTTYKGGLIRTDRLHVAIVNPNGSARFFTEKANGNFESNGVKVLNDFFMEKYFPEKFNNKGENI